MRKTEQPLREINAHRGLILSISWHPTNKNMIGILNYKTKRVEEETKS
jgi:hypothetical protein